MSFIALCHFQNCNPDTRHVTVGDLRQLMHSRTQQPAVEPPPPPPPEPQPKKIEVPVWKNPTLNPVSPGGGTVNWSTMSRKNVTFQPQNTRRNETAQNPNWLTFQHRNTGRNITAQNTDPFMFKW